ncbi:MAG: hypothetical protein SV377_05440, partial [Halobacteria archaeon]|nr:hypothetical protein [Halobacteria archaeon]
TSIASILPDMPDVGPADLTAEKFEPLTNELRVRIIVALADHQRENPDDRALPFKELRERVGERDSGKFNYHLKQLTGNYVWQSEDGYALTLAGERIVGAILSGEYSIDEEKGPIELDAKDPLTGDPLAVEWKNGFLVVRGAEERIREAGFLYRAVVPPGILTNRSFEDALELAIEITNNRYWLLTNAVCPLCYGPADRIVEFTTSPERSYHQFRGICTQCGHWKRGPVGVCILLHPVVVSFFQEHGIDVRTEPYWNLDFLFDDSYVERLSEDPLELKVRVEVGDSRLDVTLDDNGQVTGWSVTDESESHS